jgi:RNA polymerase sigma factor (sigma-70 family)
MNDARQAGLDLANMSHEQIVVLAQSANEPAATYLLGQLGIRARAWIAGWAGKRLQAADLEDAQQMAVLWMGEAIRRYQPACASKTGSFRDFLRMVLQARLQDFCKRLGRSRHRHVCLEHPLAQARISVDCPTTAAERQEMWTHYWQTMRKLSAAETALWSERVGGQSLPSIALSLGVPSRTMRSRWRALRSKVKAGLGPWFE